MAILVFDNFNRADDPTSLGTATTGQAWSQVAGPAGLGINSNNAIWTWPSALGCKAVLESGTTEGITKVTLVNQSVMDQNYGEFFGVICRYVNANFYWAAIFTKFPGPTNRLRLQRTYAGATATVIEPTVVVADGDIISVAYCGPLFELFVNGVSQGTYDDTGNPQNYGTMCGIYADSVSDFGFIAPVRWDDFTVETNGTCTPTYNCVGGACIDPGDGTGTYGTLAACLEGCGVAVSYNCVAGSCVDPGDGSGIYASLAACQASGCGVVTTNDVDTMRVDAGTGSSWYVVAPISDSGDELRSKTVKSVRVTGKVTNASAMLYRYDVSDPIVASDLEDGLNSTTGALALPDTTNVAQSPRIQTNVPNAVLHTVRVEGDDTGQTTRDRVDEIVTEQSSIGVRR